MISIIHTSKLAKHSSHSLIRHHPVRPALLVIPSLPDKLALAINLHAAKHVLGPRNPPVVRRVPQIADLPPPPSSRAAHPALRARPASTTAIQYPARSTGS